MQSYEFTTAMLALLAYRHGSEDGLAGMLGVSFVTRNRVHAGIWGGDWIAVLNHADEAYGNLADIKADIPDSRVYAIQCLLQEIDGIFRNTRKDTVTVAADSIHDQFDIGERPAPALYYARLHLPMRPEFVENICRQPDKHRLIAKIGTLSLFS